MGKEEKLTNAPVSVPISFADFMAKKPYSDPALYIPKVDGKPSVAPGKRWYVYFYWRSESGYLDQKKQYTKGINRFKTVKERKAAGKALVEITRNLLQRGWDPNKKKVVKKKTTKILSIQEALDFAYDIKMKSSRKPSTVEGYKWHLKRFNEWGDKFGLRGLEAEKFTLDHFYEFLDWLRFEYVRKDGEPLSGTSINNHKASLSALFTTMKNERLIAHNFVKGIPKIDEDPVNNKAFSVEDLKIIKAELLKKDPYLIPFIHFMLYSLLRPVEICRLKVKDLNTDKWMLSVETKTEKLSHRRIIEKMIPTVEAMNLQGAPGDYNLFSNIDKPKDWNRSEKGKADYFGNRFKKIKEELGYGREYSLYSFRHTGILDLYNTMVDDGLGEMEIIFKIMPLSKHRSIEGVRKYLRRHRESMAPDHSHLYSIDF